MATSLPTPTSVTQNLPSPFLQGAYTALGEQLLPLIATSAAIPVTTFTGSQFVAGLSDLQNQAIQGAGGLGSMLGPDAYQQYMSPYQQNVISSTLANYDIQAQQGALQNPANAIAAGAFGGARQGVQQGVYQSQSDLNRALLQSQLLNQGYTQASQQALQQEQAQQGLGAYQAQLGAQQQQAAQNVLTAQQQQAQQLAYEPYTQLGLVGQQLTGLAGGFPTQVQTYNPVQPVSPIQTALGAGLGSLGLFGSLGKTLGGLTSLG